MHNREFILEYRLKMVVELCRAPTACLMADFWQHVCLHTHRCYGLHTHFLFHHPEFFKRLKCPALEPVRPCSTTLDDWSFCFVSYLCCPIESSTCCFEARWCATNDVRSCWIRPPLGLICPQSCCRSRPHNSSLWLIRIEVLRAGAQG